MKKLFNLFFVKLNYYCITMIGKWYEWCDMLYAMINNELFDMI